MEWLSNDSSSMGITLCSEKIFCNILKPLIYTEIWGVTLLKL